MNKQNAILIALLLLLFLASFAFELPRIMNYLQVKSFWQWSLGIGAGLGLVAGLLLSWKKRQAGLDTVSQMQVFFSVFFGLCLIVPLLMSWVNRMGVPLEELTPTEVIVESEQGRYASRFGDSRLEKKQANQYLLFFYRDGKLYRTKADYKFTPEDLEAGDTIPLRIAKGRLGYEWVVI
jgi:hypothetical protein